MFSTLLGYTSTMGNTNSSSDSEDDCNIDHKTNEEDLSDGEGDLEKDVSATFDLDSLFDHTSLRSVASRIKDNVPENLTQIYNAQLCRWLEDRQLRNEETVSLSQFCDVLTNRSVSREECIQAFRQFDSEGDGTADVISMLEALKASSGLDTQGELGYVVRILQACSLTPGFIDVYNEDKESVGQHGQRILNFLLRNRAASTALPLPMLGGFNNTCNMRLGALGSYFEKHKESVSQQQQEEGLLSVGEELRPITKCCSSIDASTNKASAYRLISGDHSSPWQSDGSARSHWVRLRMKNNVVVKQLSIGVAATDQSYMPQLVSVSVGKNSLSLREIKEVRIPSHTTGQVTILENAKVFYPVIQINIKRCHSDGCDVRLHSIKTLGYRIIREAGVSVTDASAAWYLQVLSSTAAATIPVAPHLRDSILEHSKNALGYMPPLSLSPASSEKPAFLSNHVLRQMDRFLEDITKDPNGKISHDGVYVLLAFNLARGHVAGTLKSLKFIQDNRLKELAAVPLLQNLVTSRDQYWKKHGGLIQLSLAGCDGGQKEEGTGASNVLSGNWTSTQAYLSGDGKTIVNMFFKGPDHVQLTKLRIKVDKGPRGAKRGMVFVYKDEKPFVLEKNVETFQPYDKWGQVEYNFCNKVRSTGIGGKAENPVAYFTVEEDWDEVEVNLDVCPVGQYVLVKFQEPREQSAERLGIIGIKFYGFHRKGVFVQDTENEKVTPAVPSVEYVNSRDLILKTLSFIADLARDQAPQKKSTPFQKASTLDMTDISMELLWKIFSGFEDRSCHIAGLLLLHSLFPFLGNQKDNNKDASDLLFQHLCSLVDGDRENMDQTLVTVARQVIIDGAAVFFPDKEARRKQLFNMMNDVNATTEAESVSLTFQSLCRFFSSVDPSGLLDLPNTFQQDYETEPVMQVMDTLVSVAFREFKKCLSKIQECKETNQSKVDTGDQSSHLVQLLCSLQTSLFTWCYRQLHSDLKDCAQMARCIVIKFVNLVAEKCTTALELIPTQTGDHLGKLVVGLEPSFLSTTLRHMVLCLTQLCNKLNSPTRVQLLSNLMPVMKVLRKIAPLLPDHFFTFESDEWKTLDGGEVILRTWELESTHNYEDNQHYSQTFCCPGTSHFVIDFDPRCATEKRYDYLEFTDVEGVKKRFEYKIGTDKWPNTATFKGNRLHFLFHSDNSNSDWGFKFKLTAHGCPDVKLSWIFDLYLGMSKLFGKLVGATLGANKAYSLPTEGEEPKETEINVLMKSDLWRTLFRGGYMVGKLQRSFSGKYVSRENKTLPNISDSTLAEDSSAAQSFLWNMLTEKEDLAASFLQRIAENTQSSKLGGEEYNETVLAVFASLVWHTQTLREEIEKYVKLNGECKVSDGLYQAYNCAEGLRMKLMDQRQKQKLAAEKLEKDDDIGDPVSTCKSKALFLLKFAGLTKVHMKHETRNKLDRKNSKLSNKPGEKINKVDSTLEKFPSFHLVLDFLDDPAWSKERVEMLLKERSQQALAVAEVYMFAAEYVRIMTDGNIFQVNTVVFLQEVLTYQQNFARHYAEGLDGCGLDLEARVRKSYYTLVRRMVDAIRNVKRYSLAKSVLPCYDFIQACTLHLLDINWQFYDLSLLVDIKLAEFFINLAKGSVTTREKTVCEEIEEQTELEEYKKHKRWLADCKENFLTWYDKHESQSNTSVDRKEVQMFVARFSDILEVDITCNGCGITLPGRRYRCLHCQDMDLCTTCYVGGVKPVGEHTDDHDMVQLMYKCDECQSFIVGTRIHCNICEDFDLCLGCQKEGHYPAGHKPKHEVTNHPMVKLRLSQHGDSSLLSYIHQHVWLQFVSLALSMASILHNAGSKTPEVLDHDYVKSATELHNQCIALSNKCLMQVTGTDDTDESDTAEGRQARQEEAFAVHSQERILGLLGAMIPTENRNPLADDVSSMFTSEEFIKQLFSIAIGECGHDSNTQHFAMGLIGQLLQRSSIVCKDVDMSVESFCALKQSLEGSDEEGPEEKPDGYKTAAFLFSFGATCLERSGLDWANSMSDILRRLFNTTIWRSVLESHIFQCINSVKEAPELSSIFALFVIAGFPEVLSIGSPVEYVKVGTELSHGIVLKHFPDKNQTLLVDKNSRKRKNVRDEFVERVINDIQLLDKQHIRVFIDIIADICSKVKNGEAVSVERSWVMSLALKALLRLIEGGVQNAGDDLFHHRFVQCVVYLASQGTNFSRQWLLKDLEILSLMLYTKDKDAETESKVDLKEKRSNASVKNDTDSHDTDCDEDPKPLEGLDETARECFLTLHKHLAMDLSVLRAIYDMHGQSTNSLLMTVNENLNGDKYLPTEEIRNLAKKWDLSPGGQSESSISLELAEKAIDVGMQLAAAPSHTSGTLEKAVEEPTDDAQDLISTMDNDIRNDALKQRRARSATLLKKELETQGKTASREFLLKVNNAMSVLYARQVLTALLAEWPTTGPKITADMIGCKENAHVPFILDLLNAQEGKDTFKTKSQTRILNSEIGSLITYLTIQNHFISVVINVMQHLEEPALVPSALTACQFMEDVNLSTCTVESEHNYRNNTELSDKVHITGASSLAVHFDSRCCTEESCDELTIASSSNYKQNRHIFSGPRDSWVDFDLPGDTLYYKFKSDCSNNDWGYKFTVTGGRIGRFDTGYMILNCVLSQAQVVRLLDLKDVWSSLVCVCCKQTGAQRLKTIQLLLKIIQLQSRSTATEKLCLDLILLKPLWKYYNKLSNESSDFTKQPVLRALTELFLMAENLALEWEVSQEYLISLWDTEDVHRVVFQGLKNVAAVSLMIGYTNKALEGFDELAAKKEKKE